MSPRGHSSHTRSLRSFSSTPAVPAYTIAGHARRGARFRCGNVASILELDEHMEKNFKTFEAAPQAWHGMAWLAVLSDAP